MATKSSNTSFFKCPVVKLEDDYRGNSNQRKFMRVSHVQVHIITSHLHFLPSNMAPHFPVIKTKILRRQSGARTEAARATVDSVVFLGVCWLHNNCETNTAVIMLKMYIAFLYGVGSDYNTFCFFLFFLLHTFPRDARCLLNDHLGFTFCRRFLLKWQLSRVFFCLWMREVEREEWHAIKSFTFIL